MILNIITRCTRPQNLCKLKESLQTDLFEIIWYIMIDISIVKEIDTDVINDINGEGVKLFFLKGEDGDFAHQLINKAIDNIKEGWIYVLDDDNIIHENFFKRLGEEIIKNPDKQGFVFSQKVSGKDFTGLDIREAKEENMRVQHVDMAQFVLNRKLWSGYRLIKFEYKADGLLVEKIYNENRDKFHFIKEVICYYNYLKEDKMNVAPKILYIGKDQPILKSEKWADYESDALDVKYRKDDKEIIKDLYEFDPDAIVSIYEDWTKLDKLSNLPLQFRQKWINANKDINVGKASYDCALFNILNRDNKDLISISTPIFNTGENLWNAYNSLREQSYSNFEWVLMNDSTDGGKTLKIAQEISKMDPRVKVYDFKEKTGGIVGEAKYRAFGLCNGIVICEMDHDDELHNQCIEQIYSGYKKYPECGFYYNESVEIDDQRNSLMYGPGFSFGYSSYRPEIYKGREYQVAHSVNVNPLTVRHLTGLANHLRAWRRDIYYKIGGWNRRLVVADDYDLLIRTFLHTKFLRIPRLGYFQHIHNDGSNTHNLRRPLIQTYVRTISEFYKEDIRKRFLELGKFDWAFDQCKEYPINASPKFGEEEGYVNEIYQD